MLVRTCVVWDRRLGMDGRGDLQIVRWHDLAAAVMGY